MAVVVLLEVQADQVCSAEELVVLLETELVLETELLVLEELDEAQADQVCSAEELVVEAFPTEELVVEVFTAGVETTQTWVEVTVGLQLAGSTGVFQLFQSAQVELEELEAAEVVGTTGLLLVVVGTTGLLLVVRVCLQSVTVEVLTTAVQVCFPSTVQHGLVV